MSILKIDGVDGDVHRPKKFATLFATAAIAKGDVVEIDPGTDTNGSGMHVKKSSAQDNEVVIGVAETAAAAAGGRWIQRECSRFRIRYYRRRSCRL